ncbi:MAG: hypothetical protein QOE97_3765, partial [Pseudonocardiales bacterium]|nr:hypothetical protein [Pseudonocardiales bacterium]
MRPPAWTEQVAGVRMTGLSA